MNNAVKIFGISGKRLSGKDTLANLMMKHFKDRGVRVFHMPIALTLKHMYAEQNCFNPILLDDIEFKEKHRGGLIALGANKRAENKDFWISQAAGKIMMDRICRTNQPTAYFITDLRYLNEFKYLQEMFDEFFFPVRLITSAEVRKSRGWNFNARVDRDDSETELDAIQSEFCVVPNDGSMTDLCVIARFMVEEIAPQMICTHRGVINGEC